MLIPNDLYRWTQVEPIKVGTQSYGSMELTYDVRQITDVRNLGTSRAYRLSCTQRLIIPNLRKFDVAAGPVTKYDGYPAIVSSAFKLSLPGGGTARLINYSPRTVNTAVMTARNDSQGQNQSTSRQHSSGSSTSDTNSYGVNASFGFFGDDLTGSFGADYSHSHTDEHSRSASRGSEHGTSLETGSSASMSVKDWATYSSLSPDDDTSPMWIWGQEYPWDVVSYRNCPTDNNVKLPAFVLDRLFDTTVSPPGVFPPSQLSEFGIDFTMKAAWLIDVPADAIMPSAQVSHQIQYATGSHGLSGSPPTTPYVTFDPTPQLPPVTVGALPLSRLGLDPLGGPGDATGAVVGFAENKFVNPPDDGKAFQITSDENTLDVSGQGFVDVMSTDFKHGQVTMLVVFKVVDADYDYTLHLKHWKTTDNGCQLGITINNDYTVYRHVDSMEGQGGDDNLTAVNLRNKDYTSVDYHDYLQMGMNTIQIYLTPDDASKPAGYELRALAIGGS